MSPSGREEIVIGIAVAVVFRHAETGLQAVVLTVYAPYQATGEMAYQRMVDQEQAEVLRRPAAALAHGRLHPRDLLGGNRAGIFFQGLVAIDSLGGERVIVAFIRLRQIFQTAAVFIPDVRLERFIKAHDKAPWAKIEGELTILIQTQIGRQAVFQFFHGQPAAFSDIADFLSGAFLQGFEF